MIASWKIHHKEETSSTNIDARSGINGDVFTAGFQTSGRGRLDHKWYSQAGKNLLLSAVICVDDFSPEQVSTLPIVAGMSVLSAIAQICPDSRKVQLKWPNDVMLDGKKVAGILCERHNDNAIVGIGVNVKSQIFPDEISTRATFLGEEVSISDVRDAILENLKEHLALWKKFGFKAIHSLITPKIDFLHLRQVSVFQTDADSDPEPYRAMACGIDIDGSLKVGEKNIYAGEVHLEY